MFRKKLVFLLIFSFLFMYISPLAFAADKKAASKKVKDKPKTEEKIEKMETQIDTLQKQLQSLQEELERMKKEKEQEKAQQPAPAAIPAEPAPDDDEAQLKKLQEEMQSDKYGEAHSPSERQTGNVFNPDISVNGDFVWQLNHNKEVDGGNPFNLRELEFGYEGKIDPWSTMNAYVGLHNHDGQTHVHLEEAYATLNKLPLGLKMKVGKFFLDFGKDNTLHQHARPYVDVPLFVKNYLGDEGMGGSGFSISSMVPLGKIYGEVTLEAVNDENSRSYTNGKSGRPLYNGHFKLYTDLSKSSNLELGYSRMQGFNDEAARRLTTIQGMDLTYRWRPLDRGRYNSLMVRGEYLWSDRENNLSNRDTDGYYGFAEYQMNRNWFLGARYDYSEFPNLVNSHEQATSGILTYKPTEFSYYRLQYKKTTRNYARDLTEWWFQMNFLVGPHGAHEF